jgi:hypothetical protein
MRESSNKHEKNITKVRKKRASRLSPELMREIISRQGDKDRWNQQVKYLARIETKVTELAAMMYAIHGRGAVWIEWPWPESLDVIPENVGYLSMTFFRSQGMTSDYTALQVIERYEVKSQVVIMLADEIGVVYTHVIDFSRRAGGLDKMKNQLGWSDKPELWRSRITKGGE